jgi:hypothetical protein
MQIAPASVRLTSVRAVARGRAIRSRRGDPCHRIVSPTAPVGYRWGVKRALLDRIGRA